MDVRDRRMVQMAFLFLLGVIVYILLARLPFFFLHPGWWVRLGWRLLTAVVKNPAGAVKIPLNDDNANKADL